MSHRPRPRPPTARSRARQLALGLTAALAACGGTTATTPDAADCTSDPRVAPYQAGMAQQGSQGRLTFTLVSADPAPPVRGESMWMIDLSDAGGPVIGATVKVTPYMPAHQHPTGTLPTITEPAPGHYMADPVNLWMPGVWLTTIEATPAGGTADVAVFGFCIAS